MHIQIPALLALLATLTTALPQSTNPSTSLVTRGIPTEVRGVYHCNIGNWQGNCGWTQASGGRCHTWEYGRSGSFGPDKDMDCRLYRGNTCSDPIEGVAASVEYPGIADMRVLGNKYATYSDAALWTPGSYKCQWILPFVKPGTK